MWILQKKKVFKIWTIISKYAIVHFHFFWRWIQRLIQCFRIFQCCLTINTTINTNINEKLTIYQKQKSTFETKKLILKNFRKIWTKWIIAIDQKFNIDVHWITINMLKCLNNKIKKKIFSTSINKNNIMKRLKSIKKNLLNDLFFNAKLFLILNCWSTKNR